MKRWIYFGGLVLLMSVALLLTDASSDPSYGSGSSTASSGARGAGAQGAVDATRQSEGAEKKAKLLAEGKRTRSRGTIITSRNGRSKFRVKSGREFVILENSILEKLEAKGDSEVEIDARLTTYRGKNYLWVMGFQVPSESEEKASE